MDYPPLPSMGNLAWSCASSRKTPAFKVQKSNKRSQHWQVPKTMAGLLSPKVFFDSDPRTCAGAASSPASYSASSSSSPTATSSLSSAGPTHESEDGSINAATDSAAKLTLKDVWNDDWWIEIAAQGLLESDDSDGSEGLGSESEPESDDENESPLLNFSISGPPLRRHFPLHLLLQ